MSAKVVPSKSGHISFFVAVMMLWSFLGLQSRAAELAVLPSSKPPSRYVWQVKPVGGTAQLVTLVCQTCGSDANSGAGLPLLSILRDTLGDDDPENDRLTYVWLLSSTHQNIGQQLLAAVPFFYWRVGDGSTHFNENKPVKPLLDLTRPERPMSVQVLRDVLQWTVLDPVSMPVRATTRAYRTNEVARERADLEQAIGYLRLAPRSGPMAGLTDSEVNVVIARLALRKRLLGGLVASRSLQKVGEQELAQQDLVRNRNWDLLRGFAERTGLFFEPLDVGGSKGDYAVLWFPLHSGSAEPVGSSHGAVWKALNIQDPWTDARLESWEGPAFDRWLDDDGSLLPQQTTGVRKVTLVPLGAYSLTYPKFPLLMIDFRDKLHLRRDEMTQRAINEVTAGVIGISHFANWYYYVAAAGYDFVASRHGRGMDAASRLDSYSQFRSSLALDDELDPRLHSLLQHRIDSISLNPLEGSPQHKLLVAQSRYDALLDAASSGVLKEKLNKARDAEIRDFGKSQTVLAGQSFLRVTSLGILGSSSKADDDAVVRLDRERRVEARLALLQRAVGPGSDPEVTYEPARLQAAVQELSELLPSIESKNVRIEAAATLHRLSEISQDTQLQADCSTAIARLRATENQDRLGVDVAPKTAVNSLLHSDFGK